MGPLSGLMGMLPGVPKEVRDAEIDDGEIAKIEAMIRSMTPTERADPDLIDQSRRARIATGSGTGAAEVAALVKQFNEMQRMMKRMGGFGSKKVAKGRKAKKGKKGKKGRGGGRTTPKGEPELRLPDLAKELGEGDGGDGGLRLPGLK